MRINALVLIAALATPAAAGAQGTDGPLGLPAPTTGTPAAKPAALHPDDLKRVSHLQRVNRREVDMGKVAQRRGGKAVKRLGTQLLKDHLQAARELVAFAKKRGVATIPRETPETDAAREEHQAAVRTLARLKTLAGAAFDREFLLTSVMEHDRELGRNEAAIASARDPDLQELLREMSPVLQRHADAARELQRGTTTVSRAGHAPEHAPR